MSDILINGMEMPKNCEECDLSKTRHSSLGDIIDCKYIGTVGSAFKDPYNILNARHPKCPLVEVTTPHGRLIDKDKLRRELFWNFNGERIPFYDCDNFPTTITYRDLHSILSEQPTIIESEGGET